MLSQTFEDFEVVIVDDASSDDTPEVALSFADARIRYHCQPENVGVARNWSAGVGRARGEFLAILMDDDRYEVQFLARRVAALQAHPSAVFAFGGYRVIGVNDEPVKVHLPSRPVHVPLAGLDLLRAALTQECFLGAMMYRSRALRQIWHRAECAGIVVDHALNVLCALQPAAQAVYIAGVDFLRREHDAQLSHTRCDEVFDRTAGFYRDLLRQPLARSARRLIRQQFANWLVQGARSAAGRGNDRDARTKLIQAAAIDPLSRSPWTQLVRAVCGVYDAEVRRQRASLSSW